MQVFISADTVEAAATLRTFAGATGHTTLLRLRVAILNQLNDVGSKEGVYSSLAGLGVTGRYSHSYMDIRTKGHNKPAIIL